MIKRSLVVGAIATLGVLTGYAPNFSKNPIPLSFDSAAFAQGAVSDSEVTRYVQAAVAIESNRQNVYNQIKLRNGGNVPEIRCDNPAALSSLNSNIRDLARGFCRQSEQIVSRYRLENGRFNQISALRQSDANLEARIQSKLAELSGSNRRRR